MNRPQLVGNIVDHWKKYGENRPTICFCVNKEHTAATADAFNGAGIQAAFIVDDTPQHERKAIFAATARGENTVICNCATLTRGFDLPMLSCCILARPTKSLRLILQMLGRVLRASPGKENALILDHSGAILDVLGWPTEDRVWSIDPNADMQELQETERKAKGKDDLEKVCSECGRLFFKGIRICPFCGCGKVQSAKMALTEDGKLVRVQKKRKKKELTESEKLKRQWSGILIPFGKLGYHWMQAATVFHDRTGKWPKAAGMPWTVDAKDHYTKINQLFPWVNGKKK